MSEERKTGFFQRLFGLDVDKPRPAEPTPPPQKEPDAPAPKKEPPAEDPAQKEPPRDRPAKQEPPSREKPPKEVRAARASKKAPPPKGPAPSPGDTPPDERPPADRNKNEPKHGGEGGPSSPKSAPPPKPAAKPGPKRPNPGKEEKAPEEEAGPTAPSPQKDKPKAVAQPKQSWFQQLRQGLARTSTALSDNLAGALTKRKLDEETLDRIEEVLIRADLGVSVAGRIRAALAQGRYDRGLTPEDVADVVAGEIAKVLRPLAQPFARHDSTRPHVVLVVGVNGTGKTTTIGKMAHQFAQAGLSVMLAAADTFRAAAIDQLKVWGERVGAPVIAKEVGADPAGVAYEALERSREAGNDLLLIDTAGRLQNKSDLMAELAKIVRVLKKLDDTAPHSVVLILDATTGQNAINQVAIFQEIAGVTSLIITKLDGTARGGILVAIAERFKLPINAVGIGEGLDDLKPFDADDFARAIAGAKTLNEAAA